MGLPNTGGTAEHWWDCRTLVGLPNTGGTAEHWWDCRTLVFQAAIKVKQHVDKNTLDFASGSISTKSPANLRSTKNQPQLEPSSTSTQPLFNPCSTPAQNKLDFQVENQPRATYIVSTALSSQSWCPARTMSRLKICI